MQYTFEDFKNTKIAVRISNKSQLIRFLDNCEKNGVSFIPDNKSVKHWFFDWNHRDVVLFCRMNKLTWQYDDDSLPFDVRTCVHVNELLCPAVEETGRILNTCLPNGFHEPAPQAVNCRCVCLTGKPTKHPRYKIVIECAADITFATMYVDDNVVKMESAKRNPSDKFNWRIGAQTAFNRLWEKKNQKPDVREVKRHAEPGEWVKVVNATVDYNNEYKNGDILQIVQYYGNDDQVAHYKNKPSKFLYDSEYVVLEGYQPE